MAAGGAAATSSSTDGSAGTAETGRVEGGEGVCHEGVGPALTGRERGGEGAREMVRGVVATDANRGSGSGPHSLRRDQHRCVSHIPKRIQ